MSRVKDIALVGLAVSSAALAFVTWRQQAEIRRLNRAIAATAESPAAPIAIHSATRRSFNLGPRTAQIDAVAPRRRTPVADDEPQPSTVTVIPAPPTPREKRGSALARLMETPEFVQALSLQRQAMLDTRFAGLFRQLNLDGDQLAAFKRLLTEKENVALDVVAVSETSPVGPLSSEALRASVRAAQAQVEQAILGSLGNERYAVYREYERTLAQRATVAQLEQRLSYTASPLTPAQSESLVRILASTTPPPAAEETAPAISVVVRAGVPEAVPMLPTSAATGRVTEQVIAHAQTVLAPAQMSALRDIQVEQQAAVRTSELIRASLPMGDGPTVAQMLLQQ